MSLKDGAGSSDSIYSRLLTSELEDSLRFAILSEGEADVEYIIGLAKELERRGTQKPKLTPEESLDVFYEKYLGKVSPYSDCVPDPDEPDNQATVSIVSLRKRPAWRAALIAAIIFVLVFGTMIAAQAAGLDVFGAIARWTDEIFSFSQDAIDAMSESPDYSEGVNDELSQINTTNGIDSNEFKTMEEALKAYGIEKQITPTWIPDGFETAGLEVSELSNRIYIESTNANGNSVLFVSATITDSGTTVFEKTDADVLILSRNNIDYYIFDNNKTSHAVWYTEGCECNISGQVVTDELITMINSIN